MPKALVFLQLATVLREVKYLSTLGVDSIPPNAASVYEKNEILWRYHANLEITASLYNKVRKSNFSDLTYFVIFLSLHPGDNFNTH